MMKKLIILVFGCTAIVFCTYSVLSSGFPFKRVSWTVTHKTSNELVTLSSVTPEHQHKELVTVPLSVTPEHQHNEITSMDDQQSYPKHKFKPFRATGVYTYPSVCLEKNHKKASKNTNQATKKIVIYNSKRNVELVLNVSGSSFSADHNSWPLTFRKGDIPMKFKILPYPAYFVTASFPGNLCHILRDTLRGLYGVLLATNRLNSTVKNQVFTRKSYNPFKSSRNTNISTYGALIRALGVRSFPSYQSGPANVCYQHGVFGWKPVPMEELAGYIVKYFNHNDSQCDNNGTTVTFIDRAYRKVTNMVSFLELAKSMGLNAQLVRFDLMPLDQQYATIRCTDILVGVQGAGLQWVVFMRPKRALIELVYPKWQTFYARDYKGYNGLVTTTVMGQTDGAQWDWIEKAWRPYSQKEKENFKYPKYMNSKYNVSDFTAALKGIVSHPHFSKNTEN